MSSVLNLSGLNYQRSNPLRREFLAIQAELLSLKKMIVDLQMNGGSRSEPSVGPAGPAALPALLVLLVLLVLPALLVLRALRVLLALRAPKAR